jgi:DNA uptake protein ComE-like DNA-binding protein
MEELARLPGVGPMGAEVAVRLRREAGRFRSVEHFGEAPGRTPDLVAALRPLAVIGEQEGDLT